MRLSGPLCHLGRSRRGPRRDGGARPLDEDGDVERLGEVVEGAGSRRYGSRLDAPARRHEDDRGGLREAARLLEDRKAIAARHVDVADDDVRDAL